MCRRCFTVGRFAYLHSGLCWLTRERIDEDKVVLFLSRSCPNPVQMRAILSSVDPHS